MYPVSLKNHFGSACRRRHGCCYLDNGTPQFHRAFCLPVWLTGQARKPAGPVIPSEENDVLTIGEILGVATVGEMLAGFDMAVS